MKTCLWSACAPLLVALALFPTTKAVAHCDTLDGPVVAEARLALQKGDVTPVLKWVSKDNEKEIREAFALTLKVRAQGEDARRLADRHFFETLVRVHRAGEGVAFTGLKPAGEIDPAFRAADQALLDGKADELSKDVSKVVQEGLRKRFAAVMERKKHADESIAAGRAYVAAYVDYTHFIEAIYSRAEGTGESHASPEAGHGSKH